MALNYKPLWIQLAKRTKKTDVIVMVQMGKDKPITFKNIEKYVRLYPALIMKLLVLKIHVKKKF